jgi:ribosomal protein L22
MKKIARNYRLSQKTVQQIEDLVSTMGCSDATAVITRAVQDKHQRFMDEHATRLVQRKDGQYDVVVSDQKIAVINADQVEAIPVNRRKEFLGQGVLHGEVELLLDIARGGGKEITLDLDTWKKTVQRK